MRMQGKKLFTEICNQSSIQQELVETGIHKLDDHPTFSSLTPTQRLSASLHVLLDQLGDPDDPVTINRVALDYYLAEIDSMLSRQINEIIHHPEFQALESAWSALKYLLEENDETCNSKIDLINVTKEELRDDFSEVLDVRQSVLFQHIYTDEYDMPGGEPYAAIIGDYQFSSNNTDIQLLKGIAQVATAAHCPFIGNAGVALFNKQDYADLDAIDDLMEYFDKTEYTAWHAFRESELARYIGLTMPRFLLRLPYGNDNPCKQFSFIEETCCDNQYLWGNASFAFGSNLLKSFKDYGWTVNIRGSESGGRISNLPLPMCGIGLESFNQLPVECTVPEAREVALSNLGLIPLCYYKNTDYACFFSANSIQKVKSFFDRDVQANVRINSRLPYVFLVSRIGHYLKVLQRENIGANKSPKALEVELNRWLSHLVTKMPNPDHELIAKHPLREGYVEVEPNLENPGFFKVNLFVKPHFQIEGVDVKLSLVAELPGTMDNDEE